MRCSVSFTKTNFTPMNMRTQQFLLGLLMAFLFTACSRPVAYFQKSERESFTVKTKTPVAAPAAIPTSTVSEPAANELPTNQAVQAQAALTQLDAVVRNDTKLVTNRSVQKRLAHVQNLLASATKKAAASAFPAKAQKMSFAQRMLVKKMNKRISKQLAPEHPNQPMASNSILILGAIVVIAGLLVLLLTTSSTLGAIALLAGAIILLVGLLA